MPLGAGYGANDQPHNDQRRSDSHCYLRAQVALGWCLWGLSCGLRSAAAPALGHGPFRANTGGFVRAGYALERDVLGSPLPQRAVAMEDLEVEGETNSRDLAVLLGPRPWHLLSPSVLALVPAALPRRVVPACTPACCHRGPQETRGVKAGDGEH